MLHVACGLLILQMRKGLRIITVLRNGSSHRLIDADDLVHLFACLFIIGLITQGTAIITKREFIEHGLTGVTIDITAFDEGDSGGVFVGLRRAAGIRFHFGLLDLGIESGSFNTWLGCTSG